MFLAMFCFLSSLIFVAFFLTSLRKVWVASMARLQFLAGGLSEEKVLDHIHWICSCTRGSLNRCGSVWNHELLTLFSLLSKVTIMG